MEKPKSRYKYLSAHKTRSAKDGGPWMWRGFVNMGPKLGIVSSPRFPFTDEGERQAYEFCIRLKEKHTALKHLDTLRPYLTHDLYIDIMRRIEWGDVSKLMPVSSHLTRISSMVATALNVRYKDIKSDSQKPDIVEARQAAQYLCYIHTTATHQELADFFNRDRTTIIRSIKLVEEVTAVDEEFAATIDKLSKRVRRLNKNIINDKK